NCAPSRAGSTSRPALVRPAGPWLPRSAATSTPTERRRWRRWWCPTPTPRTWPIGSGPAWPRLACDCPLRAPVGNRQLIRVTKPAGDAPLRLELSGPRLGIGLASGDEGRAELDGLD